MAAFQLYDLNGDGVISLDEMTSYLTAVFKVLFQTTPEAQDIMGTSATQLGRVTAEQCFEECDLNHDGRLSFEEFQVQRTPQLTTHCTTTAHSTTQGARPVA